MAYLRRWRRYHAIADSLAFSSEDEENSSNNTERRAYSSNVSDLHNNFVINSNAEDENPQTDQELTDSNTLTDSESESEYHNDLGACSSDSSSPDIVKDLAGWANKNGCTRSSLNELLQILRRQGLRVPKDARSLLQTPREIDVVKKLGGDYLYLGIESGILKVLSKNEKQFSESNDVLLTFNVDGMPLFKSSNVQMWPILCAVEQFEPFVVAFYCGNSKSNSVSGYLEDFLPELRGILNDGINFLDKNLKVSVKAFVCDAPARAFLKCTKGHNAYYACERCVIRGKWEGRVTFGISNIDEMPALRSETSFNNFEYKDHQIKMSPLIGAGISCIKLFPLEYMHLVCLGVVKRVLMFFKTGPRKCTFTQTIGTSF